MTNKQALDAFHEGFQTFEKVPFARGEEHELVECRNYQFTPEQERKIITALTHHNHDVNKMMLDALNAIVDFDDTDFITDMSDGVDSWQSNGLSSLISKAHEAIAAASSAPVVDGLYGAIKRVEEYQEWRRGADTRQPNPEIIGQNIDIVLEAARRQLARQKGNV